MGPWTLEMPLILRHMINDVGATATYPDMRLQQLILVSAQLVQAELNLNQKYAVDVVNLTIVPDPTGATDGFSRDDSFMNLVMMKAACIIDNSEARYAAGRGVMMRDADKQIDLRGVSEAKVTIWSKGWCQNYKDTRFEYMAGGAGTVGTAIVGPFREEINTPVGPWDVDGYGVGVGYAPEYGYNGAEYGRYR
jgi:hypothetical protein